MSLIIRKLIEFKVNKLQNITSILANNKITETKMSDMHQMKALVLIAF